MDGRIDAASESKAGLHALPSGEEKTVGKLRIAWAIRQKAQPARGLNYPTLTNRPSRNVIRRSDIEAKSLSWVTITNV